MAIEQYRKTLRLRAVRPLDEVVNIWVEFLAIAAERAPQVWSDLYTSVWPAWRDGGEAAAEPSLRGWCERWWLVTPAGEPHPQAVNCARENLRLRAWREQEGQPQPPAEYIVPIVSAEQSWAGEIAPARLLPPPPRLREVSFRARLDAHQTGETIAEMRERVLRRFQRELNAQLARYAEWCVAAYGADGERRRWRRRLEWFCDYQLNSREVAQLLAGEPDADASTLRKALADVARTLNLRLRPARRGRPKK